MELFIETYIKSFVKEKTVEDVDLRFGRCIEIRHISSKGSIILAIFWVKVLQHPANFPLSKYNYQKVYNKALGSELLMVKANDVLFTVAMKTGTLTIESVFLYEWFKHDFLDFLRNFDVTFEDRWDYKPTGYRHCPCVCKKGGDEYSTCTCIRYKDPDCKYEIKATEVENYRMAKSRNKPYDIPADLAERIQERSEELITGLENITVTNMNILKGSKLDDMVSDIGHGGVRDGFSCVYRTWRSLLYKWFQTRNTRVVIVTPVMDQKRLKEIVDLFLPSRSQAQIQAIFIQKDGVEASSKDVIRAKRDIIVEYEDSLQPVIDFKVFRQIFFPWKKFGMSFVAGIKDGVAEVLITSATFSAKHFTTDHMEMVMFKRMEEREFVRQYMKPIDEGFAVIL